MRYFFIYEYLVICQTFPPNKISHISAVEFFFARSLAFTFIFCNKSGSLKIEYNFSSILSLFFNQIPTL